MRPQGETMGGAGLLRRLLLGAGVTLPWLRPAMATLPDRIASRSEARRALADMRKWGVQYQRVDVAALARSDLDLIVLDPSLNDGARRFISAQDMAALKRKPDGSRRLVIGYLCVGETDVKRWYWPPAWRTAPPAWVGPDNVNWPGSRVVRYWDEAWQALIVTGSDSILDRILAMGFDGALLDRVDAYVDWEGQYSQAPEAMVALVSRIAAKARRRHPGFLLMPQNAEHIIANPNYLAAIDALNKESLLTGLQGENRPNRPVDVEWSRQRLAVAGQAGIRLFATEYLSDPALRRRSEAQLSQWGFLPFFGTRALDRMPD